MRNLKSRSLPLREISSVISRKADCLKWLQGEYQNHNVVRPLHFQWLRSVRSVARIIKFVTLSSSRLGVSRFISLPVVSYPGLYYAGQLWVEVSGMGEKSRGTFQITHDAAKLR